MLQGLEPRSDAEIREARRADLMRKSVPELVEIIMEYERKAERLTYGMGGRGIFG